MSKKRAVKKKENLFVENYRLSWNYIKDSRNFIYVIIGVFILFILAGAFLPVPKGAEDLILKLIRELISKTEGMSHIELSTFIFFNNIQSSFFGIFFGVFFGVFSLINTIANGYLLGFVSMKSVQAENIFVLWRLLPHGIFELPALFISLGLGLKLGSFIIHKKKIETLKDYIVESLRAFLLFVLPLLIIAAIIEGTLIFFVK